jgi:hypothetical protein
MVDDETIKEIKERARLFVYDNFTNPSTSDFLIIETAMLVGASIALDQKDDEYKPTLTPDFSDRSDTNWHPACGGTETPFLSRSGARLLYCFQPSSGNHAYLNLDTDMILSQEESEQLMQLY